MRSLIAVIAAVTWIATPISAAAICQPEIFRENFEDGLGQWRTLGSATVSGSTSSQGHYSLTFTAAACRGDIFSKPLRVSPGATYRLTTDYATAGGGGYIGLDLLDARQDLLGEQWLIGDGGFPTYGDQKWNYNIEQGDPGDLNTWQKYRAENTIPINVRWVVVKIEDWGCGGLIDDPSTHPVYFDNISWKRVGAIPANRRR